MFDVFSQFHFIRPMWLFALLPVVIIIAGLILKNSRQNQWTDIIDQHLLKHLLVAQKKIHQSRTSPLLILAISLILAVLALSGPTWEKQPLPVFETELSKVIILDLSLSMESTDIKPSRLIRARYKIKDILSKTDEGQVALIVYAGDAFVISPLTTDANTILTMIPPLSPTLMPVLGSEPHRAFALADELLQNAGVFSGQIIWLTDGIDDRDYGLVADQLKSSRHQISILAVGTRDGAPIPLPDGQGFLKDPQGAIILPTLDLAPLEQLASMSNGTVTQLTADDRDIDLLLASLQAPQDFISSDDDLEMDTWVEFGPWLLLPLLLITALAFRKGVIVALFLMIMPVYSPNNLNAAEATGAPADTKEVAQPLSLPDSISKSIKQGWTDLWLTSDQQAENAYNNNNIKAAADLFEQKDWKSAALYKSGQFNAASDLLASSKSATGSYNKGNALAQLGKFEQSIAAYEQALEIEPEMEDAKFNKALVEELLKQKQEQEEQQQQEGEQQDQNQEQEKQDGEQQEGDQEDQEQEQQDGEQQEQDGEQQETEENEAEQEESDLEEMTEAEREQVLEQWLRKIKDDPGGLLRRKMYMEYQQRQQQGKKLQDKGEKVW